MELIRFKDFFESKNIEFRTARNWKDNHGLPVIKIGKNIFMRQKDYDEWIENHKTTRDPYKKFRRRKNGQLWHQKGQAEVVCLWKESTDLYP